MNKFELGDVESELLHNIYEAALAPEKWGAALAIISNHIGADEGSLIFFDAQNPTRNFLEMAFNNNKTEYLEKFIDIEVEGIKRIFKDCREGVVINAHQIAKQAGQTYEDMQSEAIQYEPRTEFAVKAVIPLIQCDTITSIMGFHCHLGAAELSTEAFVFLQRIAPHLTRAIHIHNHVTRIKQKQNSLIESLKNTDLGILLLDANLCVVFSSPETGRTFNLHGALIINKSNKLEARDMQENIRLQKSLRYFFSEGFNTSQLENDEISIALRHSDNIHPLKISILPLNHDAHGSIRLALFINDPERPRVIAQEYLQLAYSFTLTESQIAQLLLNGCNLSEIAILRNTSIETVRSQLKLLMQKSATHSQAELVRLLILLSGDYVNDKIINQ
jgi:DNA-binding CsgD family transcriptional regulator